MTRLFSVLPLALTPLLVALLPVILWSAGRLRIAFGLTRAALLLALVIMTLVVLAMRMIAVLATPARTLAFHRLARFPVRRYLNTGRVRCGNRHAAGSCCNGRRVRNRLALRRRIAVIRTASLAFTMLNVLDIATAKAVPSEAGGFDHHRVAALELPIRVSRRRRVPEKCCLSTALIQIVCDRCIDTYDVGSIAVVQASRAAPNPSRTDARGILSGETCIIRRKV